MNKSIDIKLKDFYGMISDIAVTCLSKSSAYRWISKVDEFYLTPRTIVIKRTSEYLAGVRKCPFFGQYADFLDSEEFDALDWQDKAIFFNGLKHRSLSKSAKDGSLFSLDDYRLLLKKHKKWPPYLKAASRNLIPEVQLTNITLDDLDNFCFSELDMVDQNELLKKMGPNSSYFTNLTFDGLLKHTLFKKLSPYFKGFLCKKFIFMEGHDGYSADYDLRQLPLLSQYIIWLTVGPEGQINEKDFKIYSPPISCLKNVKTLAQQEWYEELPPDLKVFLLGTHSNMKCPINQVLYSLSSILHLDSVDSYAISSFFRRMLREHKDIDDLNLNLILKSNFPLNVKLVAYRHMSTKYRTADNLYLIAYPSVVSLLLQNIYENINGSAENKDDFIRRDLSQIEFMTRDYVVAVVDNYKMLGIKIEKLFEPICLLKESVKSSSDKFGKLASIWNAILKVVELPFFFTDWNQNAKAWFENLKLEKGPFLEQEHKQKPDLQK